MSKHSYTRLWVHVLFSTKNVNPLITPSLEQDLHSHLGSQLAELGCASALINGNSDHVHLLFRQNPEFTLTNIVNQIKGNTSHWVNSHQLLPDKFTWQEGFKAFSVSDERLDEAFMRIQVQKEIHRSMSYLQEVDELIISDASVSR